MNKNYISVWSESIKTSIAVPEKTKSKGKARSSKSANKRTKSSSFLKKLNILTIAGTALIGSQSAFAISGCSLVTADFFKCESAGIGQTTPLTIDMSEAVSNVLIKDTYIDSNITFQNNPGVDYNLTLEKTINPIEAFPTNEISISSTFNFGAGNDTLTVVNSSGTSYFVDGTFNMGLGNNTVNILGQHANSYINQKGNINFDTGNNTLNIIGHALLTSDQVNFGFSGDDTVTIQDNALISNNTVVSANQGQDSLFVKTGNFDIHGDNFRNFEYFEIGTDSGSSTISTRVNLYGSALTLDAPSSKEKPSGVVINSDTQLSVIEHLFTLSISSQIKNFGVIDLAAGANPSTLVINGNYFGGANSSILFNTKLSDDDSTTSKLIINGNTSGVSKVFVNNWENGMGAKTVIGIPLITVNGTSDAVFTLGAPVQVGSFDYFLNKVDTNWLLQSVSSTCTNCSPNPTPTPTPTPTPSPTPNPTPTPTANPSPKIYRPAVAGYLQASQTFLDQNISLLGRFDQRYSKLSLNGNIWGRLVANKGKQSTSTFGYEQSGQVFQFGKDVFNHNNQDQSNINKAGVSVAIGHQNADYQDQQRSFTRYGAFTGQSNSDSVSLGAYYTRTQTDQSYLDVQALASSYRTHFRDVYDGLAKQNSLAFAFSAETGKEFAFNNNQFLLTPQMQLAYQKVNAQGLDDSVSSVSKQNTDSLRVRAGVQLKPNLKNANLENNLKSKTNWNISLNLWQELLDSPNRTISETKVQAQNLNRPWAEFGLGFTHDVNENNHFLAQIAHQQSWGSNKKSGQSININYRFQW